MEMTMTKKIKATEVAKNVSGYTNGKVFVTGGFEHGITIKSNEVVYESLGGVRIVDEDFIGMPLVEPRCNNLITKIIKFIPEAKKSANRKPR